MWDRTPAVLAVARHYTDLICKCHFRVSRTVIPQASELAVCSRDTYAVPLSADRAPFQFARVWSNPLNSYLRTIEFLSFLFMFAHYRQQPCCLPSSSRSFFPAALLCTAAPFEPEFTAVNTTLERENNCNARLHWVRGGESSQRGLLGLGGAY
jgi:hypothetical protein